MNLKKTKSYLYVVDIWLDCLTLPYLWLDCLTLPYLWLEFFCPTLEICLFSFYLRQGNQAKKAKTKSQKSQRQRQRILEYLQ